MNQPIPKINQRINQQDGNSVSKKESSSISTESEAISAIEQDDVRCAQQEWLEQFSTESEAISAIEQDDVRCAQQEWLEQFNPTGNHQLRKEFNHSNDVISAIREETRKSKEAYERKQILSN